MQVVNPISCWGKQISIDLSRNLTILSQIERIDTRIEVKEAGIKVLNVLRNIFILDPIPNHMRNYTTLSETLLSDGSNIFGVLAAIPADKKLLLEQSLTKFAFAYDHKGRTIFKKKPGIASYYMFYDQRDRLVLTQDGCNNCFGFVPAPRCSMIPMSGTE